MGQGKLVGKKGYSTCTILIGGRGRRQPKIPLPLGLQGGRKRERGWNGPPTHIRGEKRINDLIVKKRSFLIINYRDREGATALSFTSR